MIKQISPLRHRIFIEKINADGTHELVGDSGFKSEYNKDTILLLMQLMDIDLERKKLIYNILKEGEK